MTEHDPVPEAPLVDTDAGRKPAGEGWFVVNLADAAAESDDSGHAWLFQDRETARFPHFGINVQVVHPGKPNCLYHREEGQEAFLVLQGECTLIVEDQERPLRQWDFFYCPPWTAHVMVGAGDGPCAILMVGARNAGDGLLYPRSEVAARYGGSAKQDTPDAEEAYADWAPSKPARRPWPPA